MAVITLALGIGANSAIFSVVNAVLLRPLPYKDPDRLVWITESFPQFVGEAVTAPHFLEWQEQNHVFQFMAISSYSDFSLTGGDQPERVLGALVSSGFFPLLGVQPILGRTFLAEENRPGASRVVVLGYSLWQRRFGGDSNLIGKPLRLNAQTYTVVGVMPATLQVQFPVPTEMWMPLAIEAPSQPALPKPQRVLVLPGAIARLKPNITLEAAWSDLDTLARRIALRDPQEPAGQVRIIPLHQQLVGNLRSALLVLLGAVSFVLLIGCINVANLLLARAVTRQRELAIRTTLGAGRLRLIRQLLTESLLLVILSGASGLLLASWGVDLLMAITPRDLPHVQATAIDGRVIVFTLMISALTGIVFGLVPAVLGSKSNLNQSLKVGGTRSGGEFSHHRLRSFLVVSEISLALPLLIGAGLMLKSFLRLREVNPGFRPENLLTMEMDLPRYRYAESHQAIAFYQQLLQQVEALPAVRSASLVDYLPLGQLPYSQLPLSIEGRPVSASGEESLFPLLDLRSVSHNYFQTMGIRLWKGRYFTPQDREGAPSVVIINQTMANQYWPSEDPMGKRIRWGSPNHLWHSIVGVVGDVKQGGLESDSKPAIYVPYLQSAEQAGHMTLVVRTTSAPLNLAAAVRSEIWSLDKDQPVENVRTMEQILSGLVAPPRFRSTLLGIFATLALLLGAAGIYGVLSYSVNQRAHEIGVRTALGAQPQDVLKLVMGKGMLLALHGVGMGLVGAFALTRFLTSFLFGVTATDPLTFLSVSLLLIGVALLACYLPARRATMVDPIVALRYE